MLEINDGLGSFFVFKATTVTTWLFIYLNVKIYFPCKSSNVILRDEAQFLQVVTRWTVR